MAKAKNIMTLCQAQFAHPEPILLQVVPVGFLLPYWSVVFSILKLKLMQALFVDGI